MTAQHIRKLLEDFEGHDTVVHINLKKFAKWAIKTKLNQYDGYTFVDAGENIIEYYDQLMGYLTHSENDFDFNKATDILTIDFSKLDEPNAPVKRHGISYQLIHFLHCVKYAVFTDYLGMNLMQMISSYGETGLKSLIERYESDKDEIFQNFRDQVS